MTLEAQDDFQKLKAPQQTIPNCSFLTKHDWSRGWKTIILQLNEDPESDIYTDK